MQSFTIYHHSPVGWLKIQSDGECITKIHFNEEAGAECDNHPLLQLCVQQLDEYFLATRKTFDLPLKQIGTSFQQNVWDHLTRIPFGKTLSYQQLSKQIGDVKAIRAVATTNGKNNLAIVVPCHRVIGSDASLVGFSGGLWRKKWLLNHEAKHALGVQTFDF